MTIMIESFVWSYVTNNMSPIEIMDNNFSKLLFFLKIEAKMSNVYRFFQAYLQFTGTRISDLWSLHGEP